MKVINKYEYPKSTRESIQGLRHYTVDGEEQKLPSVTTVIAQTKSKKDKESIDRWKAKVGEETAEKIKNEAAARGTAMHKYLEDLIRGQRSLDLTTVGQDAQKMAEVIVDRGLNRCSDIYCIEAVLYYPGLYAGSCDLIGQVDG